MSTNALSGHGTLIDVSTDNQVTWTTIAELGNITLPDLSRNEFDATTQNEDIDSYVLGVLRRGAITVAMNLIPTNTTQNETSTGLIGLLKSKTMCAWRFRVPQDATPTYWDWIASGQVSKVGPITAPVDGKLEAQVTLRLSGKFSINGVIFG